MNKQDDFLKNQNKLRIFTDDPTLSNNSFFKLCLINWFNSQLQNKKNDSLNDIKINVKPFYERIKTKISDILLDNDLTQEEKNVFFSKNLKEINLYDYIDSNYIQEYGTYNEVFGENTKTITKADVDEYYLVSPISSMDKNDVLNVLVSWGQLSSSNQPGLINFKLKKNEIELKKNDNDEKRVVSVDNTKFTKLLTKLQSQYDVCPLMPKENKIYIREEDFANLSKYEKNVIKTIGNIYGLINDPSKDVTFETLQAVMGQLGKHKSDSEKSYMLGIFFPEKVKNVYKITPFPIPSYTYHQQFQIFIKPNVNGNFVAQLTCPYFLDDAQIIVGGANGFGVGSNFWTNTNANLDGITTRPATEWTPQFQTRVPAGVFQNAVLLFSKVSVRYIGRSDIESGYFGASFHLSTTNAESPDINVSNFDYINRSINGTVGSLAQGMNAIYYPPDFSYLNFLSVNKDNVKSNTMSTNMRLNVYGSSLPPNVVAGSTLSAGVVATVTIVWNTLPTPAYADLLPLDYNIEDQSLELVKISSIVPQSNLGTFTNAESQAIEDTLRLPTPVLNRGLEEYNNIKSTLDGKHNLLNVVGPLVDRNAVSKYKFPLDKFSIINRSTNAKNEAIDLMEQGLINK